MAIELNRRGALALLGAPLLAYAQSERNRLAAAWDDTEGRHHVGWLTADGSGWRVQRALAVPTRAHGLTLDGDALVVAARRPGQWLLRWPASGEPTWAWAEPDRRFNGHVLARGRWLYSVEADEASGHSLLVRRDARTLAGDAEWPTGGIDAHELIDLGDGSLLLALGGVPSQPETGRLKRTDQHMASSLVRLAWADGQPQGQWTLPDANLSLRHLARHAGGTVGIALQSEAFDAAARAAAPLLALWTPAAGLRLAAQPQPLAGYGGSVVATADGFAVSAPRAGGVGQWRADGQWQGLQPAAEACALALVAGRLVVGAQDTLAGLRLDNHWLAG
ncbi:MAG: DUF1513 domain-containing protein [Proteobacteria bacterium]|nr:DUF1513 domain-containing protein [Pseudomonadota bacterium]